MMFTYNGHKPEDYYFFFESCDIGLLPTARERTINIEGKPGINFQGRDFSEREFTIEGVIVPDDISLLDLYVRQFISLFSMEEDRPLIPNTEPDKYLNCRLRSNISVKSTITHCRLSIPLIAQDPFWYSVNTHEVPVISNHIIQSNGNHDTTHVTIDIRGPVTSPSLKISDMEFLYTGTLSEVDTLYIDGYNKTLRFNTANGSKYHNKIFPVIKPGKNTITLSGGSGLIKWQDCWL